ncbi:MAG: winged helix DNA-binding domain-containing protein [Actinomycetota bacterium]|nr:winged helix DNA-binding domain-containing protein [Actinomycetota bacterium]
MLAYRTSVQGLGRDARGPDDLNVFDLGVQDTNVGSARLALAARLKAGHADAVTDPAFTLLWSFRGAPHLHRTRDLPALAGALWPISDADAIARLAAERGPLKDAGVRGLEAFTAAAQAMRAVVTGPVTKGDVSTAVTARLPAAYAYDCRSCQATHVYAGLFQLVGPFAGVRLLPDHAPTTLAPLGDPPPLPPESTGPGDLIRAYLRLHGPATLTDAAKYLGSSAAAVRPAVPDDLVAVQVDGRKTWIGEEQVEPLRHASQAADLVRLLPPSDPYLQARDRDLLVPEKARQKMVWRILGNPGAVLVGHEIAGVWRVRAAGKARVEVTVQPFDGVSTAVRTAIAAEAEGVAAVRGASDVRVRYEQA